MLIGIIGFIGSGKGTVGDYLVSQWHFEQDSFAKPLKDAVSIIFGWDRDMLSGATKESRTWREEIDKYWSKIIGRTMTPRLALQLFGTECIRNVFSPNVWSASLIKRYEAYDHNVVVTDCRFKNEVQAIKDAGGYVIRVKRGEEPEWLNKYIQLVKGYNFEEIDRLRKECYIPHISETDWIGCDIDATIENDGTLEDLYKKIDSLLTTIYNIRGK